MTEARRRWRRAAAWMALALGLAAGAPAAAQKAAKSYPEKGTVIAASIAESTEYTPVFTDGRGKTHGGEAFVQRRWVYRVETGEAIYELKGGKNASLSQGDSIEFRAENGTAHVRSGDKETKYRILSKAPKSGA